MKYRASSSGVNARSRAERGARRGSSPRGARPRGAQRATERAEARDVRHRGRGETARAADVTEGRSCHASAGDSPAGVAGPDETRLSRQPPFDGSSLWDPRHSIFTRGDQQPPLERRFRADNGDGWPHSATRRPLERASRPGSDPRRTPSSRAIVGRCAREPKRASSVAVPPHGKVVRERFLGRRYFFATGAPARSSRASGTPTVGARSALQRANRLAVSDRPPRVLIRARYVIPPPPLAVEPTSTPRPAAARPVSRSRDEKACSRWSRSSPRARDARARARARPRGSRTIPSPTTRTRTPSSAAPRPRSSLAVPRERWRSRRHPRLRRRPGARKWTRQGERAADRRATRTPGLEAALRGRWRRRCASGVRQRARGDGRGSSSKMADRRGGGERREWLRRALEAARRRATEARSASGVRIASGVAELASASLRGRGGVFQSAGPGARRDDA